MLSKSASSPRRTHRKRVSALQLSTDTTATLPEYHQASASSAATVNSWNRGHSQGTSFEDDVPSDKPPDYEADEDTDSENCRNTFLVQQLPTAASATSPKRKQRYHQHKRKHSAPALQYSLSENSPVDPHLDALLERSVHALEMSNTLLQTSMTTQSSLSTVLSSDSPADITPEPRDMNLSAGVKGQWDSPPSWMEDLDEITKTVDSLIGNSVGLSEDWTGDTPDGSGIKIRSKQDWSRHLRSSGSEAGLSCSVPTAPSPLHRMSRPTRKRPSLDLRAAATGAEPSGASRLRLANRTREDLIAPPPRAITQYIESGADPAFVQLPSTIGIRSANSVYPNADWNGSTASLHSTPALPVVTETPLPHSSSPAYTKLASFVIKRPSNSANATPSSSFTSSFMIKRRNSSAEGSERRRRMPSPQPSPRLFLDFSSARSRSHSNTLISNPVNGSPLSHTHNQHRPMTPPAEESSSSDGCVAKQTISSLRKILDEQPPPVPSLKKSHTFLPLTPPPLPVSGTSTATASISRMLTKKIHHSSTRAPSPPRQSAMKGSRPATPSATPSSFPPTPTVGVIGDTLSIPERISATVHSHSASSSGRSTPKRISFAELPEAHVSSRPEKFRDKGKRKRKAGSSRGIGKGGKLIGRNDDGTTSEEDGGWFAALFGLGSGSSSAAVGGGAGGMSFVNERMEDKIARSWGGRGGGAGGCGFDEWGV